MGAERKVAVITGASQGIGAGLVEAYRERGYRVVAVARTIKPASDPEAATVAGDIADASTARQAIGEGVSRFGRSGRRDVQDLARHEGRALEIEDRADDVGDVAHVADRRTLCCAEVLNLLRRALKQGVEVTVHALQERAIDVRLRVAVIRPRRLGADDRARLVDGGACLRGKRRGQLVGDVLQGFQLPQQGRYASKVQPQLRVAVGCIGHRLLANMPCSASPAPIAERDDLPRHGRPPSQ
jgi:hypothetical protein